MNEKELLKEIQLIKERNKTVELNKKWETCFTRKLCIAILTYMVVVAYTFIIKSVDNILLSSLVPVMGFLLSTLSLNIIRKIWEKRINKKDN